MSIMDSVLSMNESTWIELRTSSMQTASEQEDPILFLSQWGKVDIIIDATVPDGIVEQYDKSFVDGLGESGEGWKRI